MEILSDHGNNKFASMKKVIEMKIPITKLAIGAQFGCVRVLVTPANKLVGRIRLCWYQTALCPHVCPRRVPSSLRDNVQ